MSNTQLVYESGLRFKSLLGGQLCRICMQTRTTINFWLELQAQHGHQSMDLLTLLTATFLTATELSTTGVPWGKVVHEADDSTGILEADEGRRGLKLSGVTDWHGTFLLTCALRVSSSFSLNSLFSSHSFS